MPAGEHGIENERRREDALPTTVQVRYTQFLDADAQLRAPLPGFARNAENLLQLYRRMVETRIFDKKALALQRAGQLRGYTAFLGQEAIVAAVASALRPDDILLGAEHESTLQQLSSASLLDVLQHWSAAQRHTRSSSGSPFTRALDIARTLQLDQRTRIVLAPGDRSLFDEDASTTHAHLGRDRNLPLIVVVPIPRHEPSPLAVHSLATEHVDGNDVIAMCDALQRGAAHARNGDGPRLIAVSICPLAEIKSADGAHGSDIEIRAAWEQCPIKRVKRYLESRQLWSVKDEEALLLSAGEQAKAAAQTLPRAGLRS